MCIIIPCIIIYGNALQYGYIISWQFPKQDTVCNLVQNIWKVKMSVQLNHLGICIAGKQVCVVVCVCEMCLHTVSVLSVCACSHAVLMLTFVSILFLQVGTWTGTFCRNTSFPQWCRMQRENSQKLFSPLNNKNCWFWSTAISAISGTVFRH